MIPWGDPLDPSWEPTKEQAAFIVGLLIGVLYLAVKGF